MPCGKINSVAQALDDPHTAARRMVETVEHPVHRRLEDARHSVQVFRHRLLGAPRAADARPAQRRDPAQELGLDEKAIAELRQEKVI